MLTVPVSTNRVGGIIDGVAKAEQCMLGHLEPGGNADKAGLKLGDVILELDGAPIASWQHFDSLSRDGAGQTARIRVERKGEELERDVVLPVKGVEDARPCLVGRIMPDSSAQEAGLKTGDLIREYDGIPIVNWLQFTRAVVEGGEKEAEVLVDRKGEAVRLKVKPRYNAERKRVLVGVEVAEVHVWPWMQYKNPIAQVRGDMRAIQRILKALVTPREARKAADALGGPVLIFVTLWASIKLSLLNAVGFLRFLNVNLAILNLLPVPVLDGGHIVFSVWEGVTRRRVHPKVANALVNVFAVLLIGALIFLTYKDVKEKLPRMLGFSWRKDKTESVEGEKDKGAQEQSPATNGLPVAQPAE
jgi:regulator of sigma E protease